MKGILARVLVAAIIGGGVLVFMGYKEARVGWDASPKPVAAALADLEQGKPLPDNHLLIDEHVRLYSEAVFQYQAKSSGQSEPTLDSKINFTYYPIISRQHPFMTALDEKVAEFGAADKIPDSEWPSLDTFAVLVKTSNFKTVRHLPDEDASEKQIRGLVINRITKLSAEEKNLLAGSFPGMDFDKVLILEQNRLPASHAKAMGLLGGGAALIVLSGLGLLLTFVRRRPRGPAVAAAGLSPLPPAMAPAGPLPPVQPMSQPATPAAGPSDEPSLR